jgi:hypothetical protein
LRKRASTGIACASQGIIPVPCGPGAIPEPTGLDSGGSWTRPGNGGALVHLPASEFLMSRAEKDPDASGDEMPQQNVDEGRPSIRGSMRRWGNAPQDCRLASHAKGTQLAGGVGSHL